MLREDCRDGQRNISALLMPISQQDSRANLELGKVKHSVKVKKTNYITVPRKEQDIPEGMWIKCDACGELLYKEDVVHNHYSCYKCGKYFRLSTKRRLRMVADKQSFEEWDTGLETANPLDYPGYPEKSDGLKEKLHIDEAVTTGVCTIKGEKNGHCSM